MKTIPPKVLAKFQELTDIVEITLKYDSFDYTIYYSPDDISQIQKYRLYRIKHLVDTLCSELDKHLKLG